MGGQSILERGAICPLEWGGEQHGHRALGSVPGSGVGTRLCIELAATHSQASRAGARQVGCGTGQRHWEPGLCRLAERPGMRLCPLEPVLPELILEGRVWSPEAGGAARGQERVLEKDVQAQVPTAQRWEGTVWPGQRHPHPRGRPSR